MKTIIEITNIIARQIGDIAKEIDEDYNIIVCPERIFLDDYLPKEEEYVARMEELPDLNSDTPLDLPYRKTIFVVVKVGSGQRNMAVSNSSATIQCLSEENDFVVARKILDSFIGFVNFEYKEGMIQSYFTPEISSSQDTVYTGFRSLLSCRGNIRVPESNVAFIQDVCISLDGVHWANLPFISATYSHSAQPDPQAFAGTKGATMSLNRQSTQTISIDTYMWNARPINDLMVTAKANFVVDMTAKREEIIEELISAEKWDLTTKKSVIALTGNDVTAKTEIMATEEYKTFAGLFETCVDKTTGKYNTVTLATGVEAFYDAIIGKFPSSYFDANYIGTNGKARFGNFVYMEMPSGLGIANGQDNAYSRRITNEIDFNLFDTDPWFYLPKFLTEQSDIVDAFCAYVLTAPDNINKKFKVTLRTNLVDNTATEILGQKRLCIMNCWNILVGVVYAQPWGDLSTWSLTFSKARETN